MAQVRVKNVKSGVEFTFTVAQWERAKNNPFFKGVFQELEPIQEPKEVKELKEKTKATKEVVKQGK